MRERISRRDFLNNISVGLAAAAGAVVSVPILAYLLSPLINPAKNVWRDLGAVNDFTVGETVKATIQDPSPLPWAGATAQTAVWVRRVAEADFTVFAVNCTHLGCPVNWVASAGLFLCPCHGGVYYANGEVAAGPPPRPLFRYQWRIADGRLQALTRALPIG